MTEGERARAARHHLAAYIYRYLHPETRVGLGSTRRYRNAPGVQCRECLLCGEQSPRWSRRWARTKTSLDWEWAHDCARSYLGAHGFASPGLYDLGVSLSAMILNGDQDPAGAVCVLEDLVKQHAV